MRNSKIWGTPGVPNSEWFNVYTRLGADNTDLIFEIFYEFSALARKRIPDGRSVVMRRSQGSMPLTERRREVIGPGVKVDKSQLKSIIFTLLSSEKTLWVDPTSMSPNSGTWKSCVRMIESDLKILRKLVNFADQIYSVKMMSSSTETRGPSLVYLSSKLSNYLDLLRRLFSEEDRRERVEMTMQCLPQEVQSAFPELGNEFWHDGSAEDVEKGGKSRFALTQEWHDPQHTFMKPESVSQLDVFLRSRSLRGLKSVLTADGFMIPVYLGEEFGEKFKPGFYVHSAILNEAFLLRNEDKALTKRGHTHSRAIDVIEQILKELGTHQAGGVAIKLSPRTTDLGGSIRVTESKKIRGGYLIGPKVLREWAEKRIRMGDLARGDYLNGLAKRLEDLKRQDVFSDAVQFQAKGFEHYYRPAKTSPVEVKVSRKPKRLVDESISVTTELAPGLSFSEEELKIAGRVLEGLLGLIRTKPTDNRKNEKGNNLQ